MKIASRAGAGAGRKPLRADTPVPANTMQKAGFAIQSQGRTEMEVTFARRAMLRVALTKVLAKRTTTYPSTP